MTDPGTVGGPDPVDPVDPTGDTGPGDAALSRRYALLVVAGLTLVVLTSVSFLLPVPYVTMQPGPVFNTLGRFDDQPMFTFGDDVKTYKDSGQLDFTTVSVSRADTDVTLAKVLRGYFDSDVNVVPRDIVYPEDQSASSARQEGQAQLTSSKDASRVAALRAAGYTVDETVTVAAVAKGAPAAGKVETGDVITSVDGRDVTTSASVVKSVSSLTPGTDVRLGLRRDGEARQVTVTTRADEADPSVSRVGVSLRPKYDFPVEIENNVGDQIGGPSAGTMFALAIYDRLTPGSLTGGRHVAGTGTIAADGTVGPIGGIRQKMAGAAAAGATTFLAPAANCAEAASGDDHGLRLVKVSTLDDAIDDLQALAKDPEAEVPTC